MVDWFTVLIRKKLLILGEENYIMVDKYTKKKLISLSGASLIAIMASTPSVWGQEADTQNSVNSNMTDIIVVSGKRPNSIMKTPLAISVVSGDFARTANLNDIKDLVKITPGISGNSQDSFLDTIAVRGIVTNDFGNGGDPSIGVYKNGFYQGRNGAAVTSLFDVEHIEILRGPQGFLFGRNAISGAISVHTTKADPDEISGYSELDVGERGVIVGEGAVNLPLSDVLGVRVAAYHSEENGWIKNLVNGQDLLAHNKDALRVSFNLNTDSLTADLIFEYEDRVQDGTVYRALGNGQGWDNLNAIANNTGNFAPPTAPSANRREVSFDTIGFEKGEVFSTGLLLDYQFENMTFSSFTGYKDHTYSYGEDFDGTDVELFYYQQDQKGKYYEQEFRLASDTDDPLSWYVGASAYKEDIDTTFLGQQAEEVYCGIYWGDTCSYAAAYYGDIFVPSANGQINDRNRTVGKFQGYSAYLDLSYSLTDALEINGGVRYTHDSKEFTQETLPVDSRFGGGVQAPQTPFPVTGKGDWNRVSWRVGMHYDLNEDVFLYGTVSTGSKSGGFPSFILGAGGVPTSYGAETVVAYELGVKATVLDGRARLNANVFHYKYKDLQEVYTVVGEILPRIGNIGKVKAIGVEGSASVIFNDFISGQVGGSLLDSSLTGAQDVCTLANPNDCEGNPLRAPEWTFFGALNVHIPVKNGEWGMDLIYSLEQGVKNPGRLSNTGVTDMALSAGFVSDKGWSVKLYVENLLNNEGYDALTDSNAVGGVTGSPYVRTGINPARPRTFGARLGYKF
ncbi:MAG: TonB-dependent receptor [Emcibacteraceae bacterium]|nr:TonB-dependent receptor [Emcibacteraceae bacterium]